MSNESTDMIKVSATDGGLQLKTVIFPDKIKEKVRAIAAMKD